MQLREIIRSFDWVAAGVTMLLVMLGLVMLFSTTADEVLFSGRFIRQLVSLVVALAAYVAISLIPYHHLRRYAVGLYAVGIVTLLAVSQLGQVIRGTTSRFEILGVQLQPSEFIKIAIIVVLAWLFTKKTMSQKTILALSSALVGVAVVLIALEPDIGVAALIVLLWVAMVIFLGTSWRVIVALGAIGIVGALGAWRWVLAGYQQARILTFLDPASDPLGAGYNIVQSIVALGSGSFFGRGLGHGPQSQLQFLPEQHTDFILASLGEELGFVGVVLVVLLYVILLWRIMQTAQVTRDQFGQYLAVGTYLVLLISFFIGAGMNMGLLPVTGIPLPLISYGGSNLVSTLVLLAIVQSIHVHNKWVRHPPIELNNIA